MTETRNIFAGSHTSAHAHSDLKVDLQQAEDGQLLKSIAILTERKPYNVLRLAAWRAGEDKALDSYRRGLPLPPRTRAELDAMFQKRVRLEHGIAARCEHDAAGMVTVLFDFLALAAVLLLLLR